MRSNFKVLFVCSILCLTHTFGKAQEETKKENDDRVWVVLSAGYLYPVGFGDNFLSKGFDLNGGGLIETIVHINSLYFGVQASYFEGNVSDITLVGNYEYSKISHHYVHGGHTFFPSVSNFQMDVGMGLGYAYYNNYQSNTRFHDDGFSIMGRVRANYRLNKIVGLYMGAQFTKDFMAIRTAAPDERFFNNTNIGVFSAGIQFYINRR